MTQYTQTAEGGTDATAITVGNSGGASGTAFGLVSKTGAATLNFSTVGKAHGTLGYRAVSTGGTTDKFSLRTDFTGSDIFADRTYFTLNALPSQAQDLVSYFDAASAHLFQISLTAGNLIRAANATGATLGTNGPALTAGTLYRVEAQWRKGTTTTDGQVAVQLFAGDSTTALWTVGPLTNVNVGITQLKYKYLGDNTAPRTLDATFDSLLLDDATQTAVGPYIAVATASVAPTSVVSGTGWTAVGAADIPTALANASDATYALSADSPAASTLIVGTNGNLGTGSIVVTPRMSKRDTTTVGTAKVTLLNSAGTPVAAEQTYTLTTTPTDYPYSLTSAENNALTSRSGLQWRIIATA